MNLLRCCFNPKVLAGLAVVVLGIVLFAPGAALSALPVLAALVCPLSMVAMVVLMGRGHGQGPKESAPHAETREERLARLQRQLREAQGQQESIAAELERLQSEDSPRVVLEAESVARQAREQN